MDLPGQPSIERDAREYFALVEEGLLSPDDRVELLEGLVVSMSPQNPRHAATVWWVSGRLQALVGDRGIVRSQLSFVATDTSVTEPDVAVVPFRSDSYQHAHPSHAFLVVEVADSSVPQDRLTKSPIYAKAGVPDYWIVNLKSRAVEWFARPDADAAVYRECGTATGEDRLPETVLAFLLRAVDLFPPA